MKIRTCLLASFGLVVPLIAMFSHLIPTGLTDTLWTVASRPTSAFFDSDAASTDPVGTEARQIPPSPAGSGFTPRRADGPAEARTVQALSSFGSAPVAGTFAEDVETREEPLTLPTVEIDLSSSAPDPLRPAPIQPTMPTATVRRPAVDAETPFSSASSPVAYYIGADSTTEAVGPASGQSHSVDEKTLRQMGCFDIVCQPTVGGRFHRCSCRVAADATGQLVRMFHATEASREDAMARLVEDVRHWKTELQIAPPPSSSQTPAVSLP
jgi:hypothetical protein